MRLKSHSEENKEKLALQKLIALSEKDVSEGKVIPMKEVFEELDIKIELLKEEWKCKKFLKHDY